MWHHFFVPRFIGCGIALRCVVGWKLACRSVKSLSGALSLAWSTLCLVAGSSLVLLARLSLRLLAWPSLLLLAEFSLLLLAKPCPRRLARVTCYASAGHPEHSLQSVARAWVWWGEEALRLPFPCNMWGDFKKYVVPRYRYRYFFRFRKNKRVKTDDLKSFVGMIKAAADGARERRVVAAARDGEEAGRGSRRAERILIDVLVNILNYWVIFILLIIIIIVFLWNGRSRGVTLLSYRSFLHTNFMSLLVFI